MAKEMAVPRKEFELLYLLASKPGKVFKRDEILREYGVAILLSETERLTYTSENYVKN